MPVVKELLMEQLQDLLHAETQLTQAIPNMVEAAHHPKLKEALEKHLAQTETQVERLKQVFEMLGEEAEATPCKAMAGLIAEGEEVIEEGAEKESLAADLALIAAAQRVEHYEISAYGTARTLARQLGIPEAARLLAHSLGEEESADFLLTTIADPLLQQATLDDLGGKVNLDRVPSERAKTPARSTGGRTRKEKGAA